MFRPVFLLASTLFAVTAFAAPINLTCAQQQVNAYYDNLSPPSEYLKDVNAVIEDAEHYLQSRVAKDPAQNAHLAIVLDIDDTSLSHYLDIKKNDFSNAPKRIDDTYHAARSPAIAPTLRLYNEARQAGVSVFFITARKPLNHDRHENLRPATVLNLQRAGYADWQGLFLPQGDDLNLSSATWKTTIRKQIAAKGYDIILNIGDQASDLVGGYADRTEKLPNYLYCTAENPCQA